MSQHLPGGYQISARRRIEPGEMVQIVGQRGLYTFIDTELAADGSVSLNFVGGPAGHHGFRSFRPDRIKKILKRAAA